MAEIIAEPGEVQDKIDANAPDDGVGSSSDERVGITLSADANYSSDNMDLPIVVRGGVTLDLNGNTITVKEDTDVFHLDSYGRLWHGLIDYREAGTDYSSHIFDMDTTMSNRSWPRNAGQTSTRKVSTIGAEGNSGTVFYMDCTDEVISRCMFDQGTYENPGEYWVLMINENKPDDSWNNGNVWHNVKVIGGEAQIELRSTEEGASIKGNHWYGHFEPNENSKWFFRGFGGRIGSQQVTLLEFPDPGGYDEGIVLIDDRHPGKQSFQHLFMDHTNVQHDQKDYGFNVGFWNNEAGEPNGWKLKNSDELLFGQYH